MTSGPSITARTLLEFLVREGVLDQSTAIGLLGEQRHTVTLNELEKLLIRRGIISNDRLALAKSTVAGLPRFDHRQISIDTSLPEDTVTALGVFLLRTPTPSIALVEDIPSTMDIITDLLGGTPDVYLMTAHEYSELLAIHYQHSARQVTETVTDIYELLDEAVRRRASDIHLSVGAPPALRIDGRIQVLNREPLTQSWMEHEIVKLVPAEWVEKWRNDHNVDAAYTFGTARFRINLGANRFGMTATLRKIPTAIPSMASLGLPDAVRRLCDLDRGIVLVVGPTGSGKSTTLASLLAHISEGMSNRKLVTLEDPIEFYLPAGAASIVDQRELGKSFTGWAEGVVQALRQDPDVILVGEMRDVSTIRAALMAAETGHLVFGTLHTYSAASTVSRIVSAFPSEEQDTVRSQLGHILKGVVAQTLLPLRSGKGRVAAFEVMLATPAISNNLKRPDGVSSLYQVMETGTQDGMITMEQSLARLVAQGLVDEDEAEHRAPNREYFRKQLDQVR